MSPTSIIVNYKRWHLWVLFRAQRGPMGNITSEIWLSDSGGKWKSRWIRIEKLKYYELVAAFSKNFVKEQTFWKNLKNESSYWRLHLWGKFYLKEGKY